MQFLQCREEWLAELVADVRDDHAYEDLKGLTDVHRLHLFDVWHAGPSDALLPM